MAGWQGRCPCIERRLQATRLQFIGAKLVNWTVSARLYWAKPWERGITVQFNLWRKLGATKGIQREQNATALGLQRKLVCKLPENHYPVEFPYIGLPTAQQLTVSIWRIEIGLDRRDRLRKRTKPQGQRCKFVKHRNLFKLEFVNGPKSGSRVD